jgi:hypothetical protein
MEQKLTEQESMKIIHEMIATSKNNLKDNSFFYLLWGWLVLIASTSHFILIKINAPNPWLLWPVLMTGGAIVSVIAGYRMGRKARVVSYTDKMMIYLWYGFMILLAVVLVMTFAEKIHWSSAYPLIISFYGLGTFVSGGVLKFRPLIVGGVSCWIISIVAFFVPSEYVLLLTALSVIIAYLIPGYILKSKAQKNV